MSTSYANSLHRGFFQSLSHGFRRVPDVTEGSKRESSHWKAPPVSDTGGRTLKYCLSLARGATDPQVICNRRGPAAEFAGDLDWLRERGLLSSISNVLIAKIITPVRAHLGTAHGREY